MKYIDDSELDQLPGRLVAGDEIFTFRCHSGLACFNQCCRNLNLFLYPYDVLRLSRALAISSDQFLDRHVDLVRRSGNAFPDVLLRMTANAEQTCPYLSDDGCAVYADRPYACRMFPIEQGSQYEADERTYHVIHLLRPPDFCLGQYESQAWTPDQWVADQDAKVHAEMTRRWSEVKILFQQDPWGVEGPGGPTAKMAFMAAYNADRFRAFVFESSFLKRYRVKADLRQKMARDDRALLLFGFDWIRVFVFGLSGKMIRPR